jgi:DNA (cytosine-5)-methyltransferase 1
MNLTKRIGDIMTSPAVDNKSYKFIDLFAGIGGMRIPFEKFGCKCVFSCDWDPDAQKMYEANFGERPAGDITQIEAAAVPDHDILLAGFPCQAFSIMGDMKGFYDTRGTLFFDIVRILAAKQPRAVLLENVKQLVGHDRGRTLKVILKQLEALGYHAHWKILNALDFGLPHKRERVFIVGFRSNYCFQFPRHGGENKTLADILEKDVPKKYYASETIQRKRKAQHIPMRNPSIWHENKAGHISSYPFCCALRASASYNYLLVNGERRLTPREMLRLLGFPDSYKIVCGYYQMRKLAGNSVCVPVVEAIAREMIRCLNGEVPIMPDGLGKGLQHELPIYEPSQVR